MKNQAEQKNHKAEKMGWRVFNVVCFLLGIYLGLKVDVVG